jgi:hypothetical protein
MQPPREDAVYAVKPSPDQEAPTARETTRQAK